jgi:nicotinate-nucleotide adenylyltransferase
MKTGLYFGSFNPLHTGHLAIFRYLLENSDLERVVLVVSPQNPLKENWEEDKRESRLKNITESIERLKSLSPEEGGLKKEDARRLSVSNIEFYMTPPLYTINTLRKLRDIEPNEKFVLIIGADNMSIIEKWHEWQKLLSEFEVWVYPRTGHDAKELCKKYGAHFIDAPLIDISSTEIRENESMGVDMSKFRV